MRQLTTAALDATAARANPRPHTHCGAWVSGVDGHAPAAQVSSTLARAAGSTGSRSKGRFEAEGAGAGSVVVAQAGVASGYVVRSAERWRRWRTRTGQGGSRKR